MSLDESWDAYRDRLRAHFGPVLGRAITDDWMVLTAAQLEREAIDSGQLRYGQPGNWFRSIRWLPAAWTALHGADGPRGR